MDKNKVVYFIISAILLCLIFTGVAYYPLAGMIVPFLVAGVSCSTTQKTGYKFSFAAIILSLVFAVAVLKFNIDNLVSMTVYMLLGVVLSTLISKKKSKSTILIVLGVAFALMYAADFAYQSIKLGENAFVFGINTFVNAYNEALKEALKLTEFSDYISVAEQYVKNMAYMVINLFPAIIVVGSAVMGYIVLCFSSLLMKIFKCENHFIPLFSTFKIDGVTAIVYLISLVMTIFIKNEILSIVFMNIYTIIQFFITVCGFSILDYYLKTKRLNIVLRFLLLIILFAVSSLSFVSIIITIVALTDARRDYRNLTGNRKYIGFVDGKPTILTQNQVEELLRKTQEEKEKEVVEEVEEIKEPTEEQTVENNENDNEEK